MHPIHPLKSHANNALLAILLGNSAGSKPAEQARKIFQQFGSWQKIFQSTAEQWNQAGFETITWQQIQACDEMNHRYLLESLKKTKLSSSKKVKRFLLQQLKPLKTEMFYLLLLDNASQLLDFQTFSQGKPHMTYLNTREILKVTLLTQARYVILGHNHPAGTVKISQADKRATKKLQLAFSWIDVEILDHIIVAGNQTISFAERGLI